MKKLLLGLSALPLSILPVAITISCAQEELPNLPAPTPELSPIELATKLMRQHIGREFEKEYMIQLDFIKDEYENGHGLQGLTYSADEINLEVVEQRINEFNKVIINEKGNYQIEYLTESDPLFSIGDPYYRLFIICKRGGVQLLAGRKVQIQRNYSKPFEFDILNGKLVLL